MTTTDNIKIYLRNDGRFQTRYKNGNDWKYVYARTESDCQKKLDRELAYRDRYSLGIRLYDWLDDWYEFYKKPNVKPSTLYTIDVVIRLHIKPNLPNKPLKDLGGFELQRFLIAIPKTRTRESVKVILSETFKDAIALRVIDYNPMLAVKIPKHKRKKGNALSLDEETEFLANIQGHKLETYFKFCLWTGCRRSEALSLTPADIDYDNKLLYIHGTKTTGSDRVIPLVPHVEQLLKNLHSAPLLFNFNPDYVTHQFKKLCPTHKLHDLRHTFATKCLSLKVIPKVLQEWLGHSEISTTLNIYAHVTKELSFSEAEKLTP